jgi:hypothetical protein
MKVYKQKQQLYCVYECQNICYSNTNNRKGTSQNGKVSGSGNASKKTHIVVNLEGKSIYPSSLICILLWNGKTKELKVEWTKPLYDKRRLLLERHKPETEASANLQ